MAGFLKKRTPSVSAIIAAAGNGTRMNIKDSKQLIEVEDMPVVAHTLFAFERSPLVDEIIIVTREQDLLVMSDIAKEFNITKVTHIIKGGQTRTDSVNNGICHAKGDYVAIHDGARPCIKTADIDKTIKRAFETGAAALGCPVTDTLKSVDENGFITKTVDRNGLWQIQTPQVFEKQLIKKAYATVDAMGATDDCMLVEATGAKVAMVQGEKSNIKITVAEDINLAKAILKEMNK